MCSGAHFSKILIITAPESCFVSRFLFKILLWACKGNRTFEKQVPNMIRLGTKNKSYCLMSRFWDITSLCLPLVLVTWADTQTKQSLCAQLKNIILIIYSLFWCFEFTLRLYVYSSYNIYS